MELNRMDERTLQVHSRLDRLEEIGTFILQAAQDSGLGAREAFQVRLAVDEAVTNAIKYAYGGREDGLVTVRCWQEAGYLVITIADQGPPFDPTSLPPPDISSDWDKRPIGGLGVFLIQQYMDEVSYRYDPAQGNILRIAKRLAR